jgi:hypothetical protein
MKSILLLLVILNYTAIAGFEKTEIGSRANALCGAFCGLSDDSWSVFSNVGGLSQVKQNEISFFISPQPFGLSELSVSAAVVSFTTNFGVIGLAGRKYGFDLYREFTFITSYAKMVSPALGVGINFNYYSVSIEKYGTAGSIGLDVGVIIHIFEKLRSGFFAKNIKIPTIGISKEKLPQSFTSGIAYMPEENIRLLFDYNKEIGFDASPKFGFEYQIINSVTLRCGVSNQPVQYAGGIGICYTVFQVDYSFSSHQDLGITHEVSFIIRWGG